MPIPQSVTASSALTQRQAYSGELALGSFERLRELLVDDAGVLQVELHAEKSLGVKRLQGTGRRAIDLVGEDQIVKQRAALELE